jgi:hypothetical protein
MVDCAHAVPLQHNVGVVTRANPSERLARAEMIGQRVTTMRHGVDRHTRPALYLSSQLLQHGVQRVVHRVAVAHE